MSKNDLIREDKKLSRRPDRTTGEHLLRYQIEHSRYHLYNLDDDRTHYPYEFEALIFQCITEGDYENALKYLETIFDNSNYDVGTLAYTESKQAEYSAVLIVSFYCRASISGGLDPLVAYDRNDLYLQNISEMSTVEEYYQIIKEALLDFCTLIQKNKKNSTQSLHVKRCKQYIYQHLSQKFTLEEMSHTLGLNKSYLSGLFHKHENITIKAYIIQERIYASENMLKYSNYSVLEIANRFCFETQSHYGQVFKKYTSMTPTEYRNKFKPVSFTSEFS